GLEVGWIRRIHELDTTYWGFLRVWTTFDIFQNIMLIPYLEYGVLGPLDTAYWYQANPKESHLVAIKRIFRYLKGTPNLDRKSTSGGYQILRGNLVCWSARKQSPVAISSAKAESPTMTAHQAPVLTVGHNAKKRKTSHSNWKRKAAKGKSDRGSKRKVESEIAPTSDPTEAVCFYCNTNRHWKRSYLKYLKGLKHGKVKKGSHSGLKESRRLKHGELNLVMRNRKITHVTRIGKYELMLKSEVRIDLNNFCYSS
ncbi:vesicle transport v-SNARE 11-like protein, partial [Tanacetum coccineum]